MARRPTKLKLILQLIPIILVAIAGIAGASRLQMVREFLAGASGQEANIQIDANVAYGPIQKPWQNLAQGGEMSDWRLTPIKGKVAALQPQYIRIDHIYSFYDIVQKDGEQLKFNFSKLDPLVDDIVATGAKPYIALSYMPAPISDDGTITGKPQKWEYWQETVRATIQHYSGEKAIDGVIYEVWNEPDLFGGWKTYGDKNYLTLYTYAHRGQASVRNAKPYQFGGPAITALYENWFTKLVEHAQNNNLRLDFFSWHRYNMDVEQYRKDYAQAIEWRARYPAQSNLQLHVTEVGHDSKNHPGYDTSFGAAHTAAIGIESVGNADRIFPFEIEDGKDPAGQERWGRWGMLTHRDFGNNIKPRYLAMRLMNRIGGNQVQLLGKGTWVKAVATKNGDVIEMLIANYDRYAGHVENVPVTYKNVAAGTYVLEITDAGGSTRKVNLTSEGNEVKTQIFMAANSVLFTRLVPNEITGPAPTTESPVSETIPAAPENLDATPVQTSDTPVEATPGVSADNPFLQ